MTYFPVDNSMNAKPLEKIEPLPIPDICVDMLELML